ncbi:hypothetical protein MpV1_178 [Micromonas sp. RCC1109 virus MpV1]|jgi:hypothetical protein|uniref:hypothetical protein n=1 Tax=Micromonas sp. RCC1109 virus MpV1 TaxID=880161 RepID=UPI0001EF44CB|nr:hypothetical protein MpV1_178 [Micromonas sp. RCC1109 virus MpV1]ADQ91101.1 hypothetical protein MpV1_178 [Micromonas sp. RCC1109 virus MpV1]
MTRSFKINVTDSTKPKDLDLCFRQAWLYNEPIRFEIDTTECRQVSLNRILSMKDVLDKHREKSRKYIDYTVVIVKSRIARFLMRTGLSIIRTERPVYINSPT